MTGPSMHCHIFGRALHCYRYRHWSLDFPMPVISMQREKKKKEQEDPKRWGWLHIDTSELDNRNDPCIWGRCRLVVVWSNWRDLYILGESVLQFPLPRSLFCGILNCRARCYQYGGDVAFVPRNSLAQEADDGGFPL